MAGTDVNQLVIVARSLAGIAAYQDGQSPAGGIRVGRYREQYVESMIPTKHMLADEGSYFVANNAQSGLATAATPTAFSATNPFITIFNNDNVNSPLAKRISVDYLTLIATAAGTAGTNVQAAVVIDSGNRFSSGGTALTPAKANSAGPGSIAIVNAGNLTATAATGQARTIVGLRFLKGAIPVAGDTYTLVSGSVDVPALLNISTILMSVQGIPPVVINPNETALFYIWLASQSAASSYAPDLAWWER